MQGEEKSHCGTRGCWRTERTNKPQGPASMSSSAAVTLSMGGPASEMDSSIQEEFMILSEVPPSATQGILYEEPIYLRPVFYGAGFRARTNPPRPKNMRVLRDQIWRPYCGGYDGNFGVKTLASRIEQKLRQQGSQRDSPADLSKRIFASKSRERFPG